MSYSSSLSSIYTSSTESRTFTFDKEYEESHDDDTLSTQDSSYTIWDEEEKDEICESHLDNNTKEAETPLNNIMDVLNIFIRPNEISKKNKPKNTSFKKKHFNNSNKRFTVKNYQH